MASHRTRRLSEDSWDALLEAWATFFWFKRDFENHIRSSFADAPAVVATLNFEEPKRVVSSQLIARLRREEAEHQDLVVDCLLRLAESDETFPRLVRLDDGVDKVERANEALQRLRSVVSKHQEIVAGREAARDRIAKHAAESTLKRDHAAEIGKLHETFLALHSSSDPHARGTLFEALLNRLFELHDLHPRAAYRLESEQIDRAFTFQSADYLLEAKWWATRLEPKHLNDFAAKVDAKAKNTVGLLIAVSGFTPGAIDKHSVRISLLLMDGADLSAILEARVPLDEVLERKRRHAAETGNPFLPVREMI